MLGRICYGAAARQLHRSSKRPQSKYLSKAKSNAPFPPKSTTKSALNKSDRICASCSCSCKQCSCSGVSASESAERYDAEAPQYCIAAYRSIRCKRWSQKKVLSRQEAFIEGLRSRHSRDLVLMAYYSGSRQNRSSPHPGAWLPTHHHVPHPSNDT